MRITAILVVVGLSFMPAAAAAQRRSGGPATLVIMVTDASGAGVGDVRVGLDGPAAREGRTEQGRLVFENIPSGSYRVTFQREGFVTLEREVAAKGGAPIDVKVTLDRVPPPKPPPPPLKPVEPVIEASPVAIDVPTFIEKNFVGRAAGKTSLLACAAGGEATLIQVRQPLAEHVHAGADEYLYVIAGEGTGRIGASDEPLHAGIFLLVPRGVRHTLISSGRSSPLVVISVKAGEKCAPAVG